MFPSESDLTICFAHVAYQLQQRFALRKLPIRNFGVTSHDELDARIGEADVRVIGVKRDLSKGTEGADSVHTLAELKTLLPQADFVALTCPLTRETENVIDAAAFAKMKPCAYLINAARGRCVEEGALIEALRKGSIAGAALDVTVDEPLPPASPGWDLSNVFITPHIAGETRRYEA